MARRCLQCRGLWPPPRALHRRHRGQRGPWPPLCRGCVAGGPRGRGERTGLERVWRAAGRGRRGLPAAHLAPARRRAAPLPGHGGALGGAQAAAAGMPALGAGRVHRRCWPCCGSSGRAYAAARPPAPPPAQGHTSNILGAAFLPCTSGGQLVCCSADRQVRSARCVAWCVRPGDSGRTRGWPSAAHKGRVPHAWRRPLAAAAGASPACGARRCAAVRAAPRAGAHPGGAGPT